MTTKILLTYYVGGRLLGNRSSKVVKKSIKTNHGRKLVLTNAPKDDLIQEKVPVKLNISEFAYNHMTSESYPEKFDNFRGRKVWTSFNRRQRLEWHLNQIADGREYHYEVID